ncbi:MAG TPA: 50S ribosomal protein L29 [Tenericutes bacterium]|nr:50S ribosomal protein L29 [Mycoplasmatota bacterium]
MKTQEIRKLQTPDIENKIKELKEELFNLRFQQATGNLQNPARIKQIRKTIARMKTIINERLLEEESKGGNL